MSDTTNNSKNNNAAADLVGSGVVNLLEALKESFRLRGAVSMKRLINVEGAGGATAVAPATETTGEDDSADMNRKRKHGGEYIIYFYHQHLFFIALLHATYYIFFH